MASRDTEMMLMVWVAWENKGQSQAFTSILLL